MVFFDSAPRLVVLLDGAGEFGWASVGRGIGAIVYKRQRGRCGKRSCMTGGIGGVCLSFSGSIESGALFAMVKHQLGSCKVRCRGLEKNRFDVCPMLMACNLYAKRVLGSKCLEPVPKKV